MNYFSRYIMKFQLTIKISQYVQRFSDRRGIRKHFSTDSNSIQLQNMNYIQICGKDTKKFLDNMLNASLNKVSEKEYSRMKENYNLFKSI